VTRGGTSRSRKRVSGLQRPGERVPVKKGSGVQGFFWSTYSTFVLIFSNTNTKRNKRIASQASRESFPKMSGRGRGFRGKHSGRGRGSKKKSSDPHKNPKKSLQDYVYYLGSPKQASDFTTTTEYIINYIRRMFTQGNDIANNLEERKEVTMMDFMPVL
jgi:hypothetical protein